MATKRTLADFHIEVGTMKKGPLNAITDVEGVLVGHETVDTLRGKTGVTVILPGSKNPFIQKSKGACYVLNGFGKTAGLMQIEELGNIESPIALTNTLNVGLVQDALVEYVLKECEKQGVEATSINTVVGECNDSQLNDIAQRAVTKKMVLAAIDKADKTFLQGDVGAGKGTICYGWKGGIGSSSREVMVNEKNYTLGVLVQSNYGNSKDLIINGKNLSDHQKSTLKGKEIKEIAETVDQGSIMMVMATDLPLSTRQLKRVLKRLSVAMARLGSYIGHGSGEVMIGFTTVDPLYLHEKRETITQEVLREDLLNPVFRAAGESCEEAILLSMLCADEVMGYKGNRVQSLGAFLKKNPL